MQEAGDLLVVACDLVLPSPFQVGQLRHLAIELACHCRQVCRQVRDLFRDAAIRHRTFGPQAKVDVEMDKGDLISNWTSGHSAILARIICSVCLDNSAVVGMIGTNHEPGEQPCHGTK